MIAQERIPGDLQIMLNYGKEKSLFLTFKDFLGKTGSEVSPLSVPLVICTYCSLFIYYYFQFLENGVYLIFSFLTLCL